MTRWTTLHAYLTDDYNVQEMSTDKAIELLRRQLKTHSTARLHQMLADLLAKTHDEEQALEHYTIGT